MRRFVFAVATVAAASSAIASPNPPEAPAPLAVPANLRCGTLPALAGKTWPTHIPPTLRPGPGKLLRDDFGGSYTVRESANFAVKWEADVLASEADATATLDALEVAYTHYRSLLGHDEPTGAGTYKINVYLAGPNNNPGIDFAGGYATLDGDGIPYMVLSEDLLGRPNDLAAVATHELYHDFQMSTNAFGFGGNSDWWWEATAEWAAQEVLPSNRDVWAFVGAFALGEELPINYFGDPFSNSPLGVHQYGASIFAQYISTRYDDPQLIADTWKTAGPSDDPLEILAGQLPDPLADVFVDFAAVNVNWEYAQGAFIDAWVDAYVGAYPDRPRMDGVVDGNGTADWVAVPTDKQPRPFGYALIELQRPASGYAALEIEVLPNGQSVDGSVHVQVVKLELDGYSKTPVPMTNGVGTLAIEFENFQTVAHVVVANTLTSSNQALPVRYRVNTTRPGPTPEPEPEPEPEDLGGCCSTGGDAPFGNALWAGLALAWLSRRRRRHD